MSGLIQPKPVKLPLNMSEADWQRRVIDYAKLRQWLVAHFRPSRTQSGRWSTAMTGDIGYPDLTLARHGVVVLAELKTQHGVVTPGQKIWIAASGAHLWRPSDWDEVVETLR